MNILVVNAGSSSIKCALKDSESGLSLLECQAERILDRAQILCSPGEHIQTELSGHAPVLDALLQTLKAQLGHLRVDAVGHRVVHGGEHFEQAARITPDVLTAIESLNELAPLHQPINVLGIRAAMQHFPDVPQIAVFDTAFHRTLPRRAQAYALPADWVKKYKIRRYGFHGISHQYVAQLAAEQLQMPLDSLRLITCHLGNGASITAVEYGRSVETSMGMTPLEGLVMGTRAGDVDPGVLSMIMEKEGLSAAQLEERLNKDSGLKGLSGLSNDMRDIVERAAEGDEACRMAIQVFTHRIRKYIGAYAAVMGGVDAIVFTGGIGENSPGIRYRICQRLDFLGILVDEDNNQDLHLSAEAPVADFAMRHSRVRLLAVKTDEQFAIARRAAKVVEERSKVNTVPAIPIAISARHVHLTQATVEKLFGPGYQLSERNPLSQPGQFAANETVTVVGPKHSIERVRILGPVRSYDQVEISRTDEFFLGIDAPVRESGKIDNTPGCTLIGPAGKVALDKGVICAWRHIHMTPQDAETFGVKDRDVVEVHIESEERSLTFGNVLVRIAPDFKLEMHIDTDEGNAAEICGSSRGVLVALQSGSARLTKRRF